jgi:hypothetical protein
VNPCLGWSRRGAGARGGLQAGGVGGGLIGPGDAQGVGDVLCAGARQGAGGGREGSGGGWEGLGGGWEGLGGGGVKARVMEARQVPSSPAAAVEKAAAVPIARSYGWSGVLRAGLGVRPLGRRGGGP